MKTFKVQFVANVTYLENTFNTPLIVEYKHTGLMWYKNKNHFTSSPEIAERWQKEGKKVKVDKGHYFIDRLAIPTINAKGEKDIWYINNPGDKYKINKVSKYGQKLQKQISTL